MSDAARFPILRPREVVGAMGEPIPVLDVMTDELEPWPMAAEQILSGPPRMASRDLYRAEDDSTWIAVWTLHRGLVLVAVCR